MSDRDLLNTGKATIKNLNNVGLKKREKESLKGIEKIKAEGAKKEANNPNIGYSVLPTSQ